jgi:hypothetical protein
MQCPGRPADYPRRLDPRGHCDAESLPAAQRIGLSKRAEKRGERAARPGQASTRTARGRHALPLAHFMNTK